MAKAQTDEPHVSRVMDFTEAQEVIEGLARLFQGNPAAAQWGQSFLTGGPERQSAAKRLPNQDARFRIFVEQIPAVIFMAYLDRGISEAYVSPHIESVLGFSQQEWLDDPVRWYRQIHPDDKERWSLEAARMLMTGEPLKSVYRVLARDGRVVWFQCDAKLIRDENGRPWFIHGLAVDITELRETQANLQRSHEELRKRASELEVANVKLSQEIAERQAAEKRLRDSQENFRLLVEGVRDYALYLLDPAGRVVSWNAGAERLKCYSPDEILGKHFAVFYTQEDIQNGEPAKDLQIAKLQGRHESEGWRLRKDGSKFWANALVTALTHPDGQLYGFAKLTRDMTEQKLIRDKLQESERLAAMGTTAAMFAHEIGNPLNAISTCLQVLQCDLAGKDHARWITESIETVLQEIKSLGLLLSDFRSLARPRELNLSPVNIVEIVREIMALRAPYHTEHGITVEQEFAPDLPVVMADSRMLKQMLLNLCKNAAEAMPQGGTLTIRIRRGPGVMRLDVQDTGVGIPDNFQVFELFKTTKDQGTGLGLAIVRQIISAHQGTISYQSERGKGTTFTISLPVAGDASDHNRLSPDGSS